MDATNARTARMLREFAQLLEAQQADRFRVRAYRDAARAIDDLSEPIPALLAQDPKALTRIRGIGSKLASVIEEFAQTGTVRRLDELRAGTPGASLAHVNLPGFSTRRLAPLMEALGVRTLTDLETAARRGLVREVRGWGPGTEAKLIAALERHGREPVVLTRWAAESWGRALVRFLAPAAGHGGSADLAGECRRLCDAVHGLAVAVTSDDPAAVLARFHEYPELERADPPREGAASGVLFNGLPVTVEVAPPSCRGTLLHRLTGSDAHVRALAKVAATAGVDLDNAPTERALFERLGLPPIPPELRENRGEIEAARAGTLPRAIRRGDLRGDLQMHSTGSDGTNTIEEMAVAARERGYAYVAITDHTTSLRVVQGLGPREFRAQWKEIDRLNARLDGMTVLRGAEVDVLADGALDLDDETLRALDIVLVSIHSKFDLPPDEQTRRVLRAVRHPAVHVFAHPIGRIIGHRRGAQFDWNAVLRACRDHGTALEINASPDRLDMPAEIAQEAVRLGIPVTISTDAHAIHELDLVDWGLAQARRGWVEPRHVLNARPLDGLMRFLAKGRARVH